VDFVGYVVVNSVFVGSNFHSRDLSLSFLGGEGFFCDIGCDGVDPAGELVPAFVVLHECRHAYEDHRYYVLCIFFACQVVLCDPPYAFFVPIPEDFECSMVSGPCHGYK